MNTCRKLNFLHHKQFHFARLMKATKLFLGNASAICTQHFIMMIYAIRFTACYLGKKEDVEGIVSGLDFPALLYLSPLAPQVCKREKHPISMIYIYQQCKTFLLSVLVFFHRRFAREQKSSERLGNIIYLI